MGFLAFGRRWAAANCGLIDLTTASGRRKHSLDVKPVIRQAADCFCSGETPEQYAIDTGVEVGSAWTYFCQAAAKVHPEDVKKLVPPLISRDLWKVLKKLHRAGDPILGGKLNDLLVRVDQELPVGCEFRRSEQQIAQLRLGRLALQAQQC